MSARRLQSLTQKGTHLVEHVECFRQAVTQIADQRQDEGPLLIVHRCEAACAAGSAHPGEVHILGIHRHPYNVAVNLIVTMNIASRSAEHLIIDMGRPLWRYRFEFVESVAEAYELRRTHEREVKRIEHQHLVSPCSKKKKAQPPHPIFR